MSECTYKLSIGNDTLGRLCKGEEKDFTFIMCCEGEKEDPIKTTKKFAMAFSKKVKIQCAETSDDAEKKQSYKIEYDIKNRETFNIMKIVIENGKYEGEQPECVCEDLFNIGYELSRQDMMNSYFNILSSRDIKEEDVDHYLSCAKMFGEPLKKKVVKYIAQNFHMLSDRIPEFVSKYGITLIEEIEKDQDFRPTNEDEYARVVYKICQKDMSCIRMIETIHSPYVSAKIKGDIFDMYSQLVKDKLDESDGKNISCFHPFFKNALSPPSSMTDMYPRKIASDKCFDDICRYKTFNRSVTLESLKSKLSELEAAHDQLLISKSAAESKTDSQQEKLNYADLLKENEIRQSVYSNIIDLIQKLQDQKQNENKLLRAKIEYLEKELKNCQNENTAYEEKIAKQEDENKKQEKFLTDLKQKDIELQKEIDKYKKRKIELSKNRDELLHIIDRKKEIAGQVEQLVPTEEN